jgi:hypothetical protein
MRIISSGSAIDREALAADYAFVDAAGQHGLEQAAKQVAVAEATMAVLGKRGVVRHPAVQIETASAGDTNLWTTGERHKFTAQTAEVDEAVDAAQ